MCDAKRGIPSGQLGASFGRAVKLDQSGYTCAIGMPFYLNGQLQLFQFNLTSSKWGFDQVLNVSATGTTSGVTNLGESIAMTPDASIIAAGAPTSTSGEWMYQQLWAMPSWLANQFASLSCVLTGHLVVWNASSGYSYRSCSGPYPGNLFSTIAISGDGEYILAGAPDFGYSPTRNRGTALASETAVPAPCSC